MPVDTSLADLSHTLFVVAMFGYLVAMFGFALEPVLLRRSIAGDLVADQQPADQQPTVHTAQPVREAVGVGAGVAAGPSLPTAPARSAAVPSGARLPAGPGARPPADPGDARSPVDGGDGGATWARRTAITVMALAFAVHVASTVARGLAVHRPPFGNMFEFSSALALSATGVFLVLLVRQRVSYLGVYLLVPVLLTMGVADTILYVPAEPLQPVLNSYWLWIHVTAAIVSTGVFLVGCTAGALYLVADSYRTRMAQGREPGLTALARRLPAPAVLDRLSYRTIAAGFPLWTFAVIAGAVWAESAWGRYWGWDPKETWAFITWVIFAGYLHARSTAGWRGRKAAWITVIGLFAFTFNYFGVNFWVNGLHSYAGV